MSSNDAVIFDHVTKRYSKYDGFLRVKNMLDRLKNGHIGSELAREKEFYALKDVSFTLKKGERLGIIGPNGAGKSTTLKLVNHIIHPTQGRIMVDGKVGGLIEMQAGFQGDLTGRENIYLNASLLGFSRKATDRILDQIIEIAEIEPFIDVPLKRYSSGMKVRLGFAVALSAVPDVVLLDEVLAVGDARFKKKSIELVNQYLAGRTLIFVSHNLKQIMEVCDRCIVLREGEIAFDGPVLDAIEYYQDLQELIPDTSSEVVVARNLRRGFCKKPLVGVQGVELLDESGVSCTKIPKGLRPTVHVKFGIDDIQGVLDIRVRIKRQHLGQAAETIGGTRCHFGVNSPADNLVRLSFDTGNLRAGHYILEIIPEFSKQSKTTGVAVYQQTFEIVAVHEQTDIGLLDLNFQVDPPQRKSVSPI